MKHSEPTPKQRRRRLDFAVLVKVLATAAPDAETKRQLNSVVKSIEVRFGFKEAEKQKLVIDAIREGCVTSREIAEHTGLPRQVVEPMLAQMTTTELIRRQKISPAGSRGGRPIDGYFLTV